MPKHRALKVAAGIAVSFAALVAVIIYLAAAKIVSFELGMLMFVELLGLYIGIGILIAIYRLVGKLE